MKIQCVKSFRVEGDPHVTRDPRKRWGGDIYWVPAGTYRYVKPLPVYGIQLK
jgi:hypothetical protein